MFTKEGPVKLIVGEVKFAEPRFAEGKGPADFDICIEVTNADNADEHDWVRLDYSENYGRGVFSTTRQREITMRTLRGIGFDSNDLTMLPDFLGGKVVNGVVKASKPNADGKVYMNVYLGGGAGNAPKSEDVLSREELKRRLTGASGAGAKPAAASVPSRPNVFKPRATTAQAPAQAPAQEPVTDESEPF